MAILDDIINAVDEIAKSSWDVKEGTIVPKTEDVGLGNKGVELDAVMFYADLADSTTLATHSRRIAAEVYKAFLLCGTKLILHNGGAIRSFDGDRVMGVFIDGAKNTAAVRAALQLKYVFDEVLVPRFKKQYDVFQNGTLVLNYCSGIDVGKVLVARAGVRKNNDLVWVGQAPNIAAKLSTKRFPPNRTYITKAVYEHMLDSVKTSDGTKTGTNMWEARTDSDFPAAKQSLYRSSWRMEP